MSLSVVPILSGIVWDPRIDVHEQNEYAIEKSCLVNTYQNLAANSISNSQIVFASVPPSITTFMNSKVAVVVPIRFTFTGPDSGTPLLQIGSNDALKYLPLHNYLFQTITVSINNTAFTIQASNYTEPLMRMQNNEYLRKYEYSGSPSFMDPYQDYADYAVFDPSNGNVNSANNNPLAAYGNSDTNPRGGFKYCVVSNTNTSAIVDVEIEEELLMSPFYFNKGNREAFYGINNFNFTFNLNPQALGNGSMWAHSSLGNTLTSVSAQIIGAPGGLIPGSGNANYPIANLLYMQPTLLLNFMTPPMTMVVPRVLTYPYFETTSYSTPCGNILGYNSIGYSSTSSIITNNIQLQTIPRRLYVVVKRTNQEKSYLTTDSYARINAIQVNYNNRAGLLSTARAYDLWAMSRDNGLLMDWPSWYLKTGSVICIDPTKDFGLDDDESSGCLAQINLQIQISFTNISGSDITFDAWIIAISEGTFSVDSATNSAYKQIGVVSKADILNSKDLPKIDYHQIHNMFGGADIFGSIKKFGKNLKKFAVKSAPYVKKGAELAVKYGPEVAKAVATYGPEVAKAVATYGPKALALLGLGEDGGALIAHGSKEQMKKKMAKLRQAKLKNRY